MLARLFSVALFLLCSGVVFWQALVHTVHRGTLAVPDLRGEILEQAERVLHDVGLALSVDDAGVFSTSFAPGAIASQDPLPGFHVKAGSSVTVRLSLGGERIRIPDVRGESLQGGIRGIEQTGLSQGRRVQVQGQAGGDSVLASEPPIGAEVAPETQINLLVNVAPAADLWVMPSLLSHPLQEVRRFCRERQLRIGQIHEVGYPGLTTGLVLRQYPPAGAPLSRSDIITIWVSR